MARFLLVPLGSYGDVHPFVGLALALRQRGHHATVATNDYFRPICERVGLPFVALGTAEQYLELTQRPGLWDSRAGLRIVLKEVAERGLRLAYAAIAAWHAEGPGAVAAGSLAFGARIAQEHLGVPTATVHLQPSVVRSVQAFPQLPGAPDPKWVPHWLRRAAYSFGDRWVLDPLLEPPVNSLRAELGLPPIRHPMRDWWHAPQLCLGMWPEWYAAPAADWPPQLKCVGFPLYDEAGAVPLPAELQSFLDAGPPPVSFTAGSAMRHGHAFFAAAAAGCARAGVRGVLLTRYAEQIPARLPAGVIHCPFAPFSALLPHCAAACHHAGIGSSAQALRAGVPQLLLDLNAFDQPDNIARLKRLGVGISLRRRKFTAPRVAAALQQLLGDEPLRQRCAAVRQRFAGADGLAAACAELERLA